MKTKKNIQQALKGIFMMACALMFSYFSSAQSKVNSVSIESFTAPMVTYNNAKGAGLRDSTGATLVSKWDSSGTAFTINYNFGGTANIRSITQFSVNGMTDSIAIRLPQNATVKVRRLANAYVNSNRNHFNFWAMYSSIPAAGAVSGTFNFISQEVSNPDDAFMSNNINSGYDNIFQNTHTFLHASNVERIDYIITDPIKPTGAKDLTNIGMLVVDRGAGDPFKVAAITSLDGAGNPLTFGSLVSVTAAQFGPDLVTPFTYCISTQDPNFGIVARPSTFSSQSVRGVYVSLANMGIALNQDFYGYALFGNDVTSAVPNWNTYPNNTSAASQLDPANVMGMYRTGILVLPVRMNFSLEKQETQTRIGFNLYNNISLSEIVVERSADGLRFNEIATLPVLHKGMYYYEDAQPLNGDNFYRLKLKERDGSASISEVKKIRFSTAAEENITVFPNPVKDCINISLPESWNGQPVSIRIINESGNVVYGNRRPHAASVCSVYGLNFPAGTYTVKVTGSGASKELSSRVLVLPK